MPSASSSTPAVGGYELGRRLGGGTLGRVYLARARDGREVAVKLLAPDAELDDPRARDRLRREIAALGAIRHPRVVPLLDHGEDGELGTYLVMPLLAGETLRARCLAWRPSPPSACAIVWALADATAALHAAGLVHRDLKPENVMCTDDQQLVLIDLGLALGAAHTRHTEQGAIAGSVPYMAPEQIQGAELSAATDVWALGVILFELISGRRPFARDTAAEEVAAILAGGAARLDEVDRRVDRALGELVAECLASEPGARPRDGAQLAARLCAQTSGVIDDLDRTVRELLGPRRDEVDAAIAERVVVSLVAEARASAKRGASFDGLRAVDRALAYRPDDPALVALVHELSARERVANPWLVPVAVILAVVVALMLGVWLLARGGADERTAAPVRSDASLAQPSPVLADAMIARTEGLAAWPGIPEAALPEQVPAMLAELETTTYVRSTAPEPCRRRSWEECERAFSERLETSPGDLATRKLRGVLRYRLGKLRVAHADLHAVLQGSPDDLDTARELAHLADYIGRRADAALLLGEVVARQPSADHWLDLAMVQGEADSLASIERAAAVDPSSARVAELRCILHTYYRRPDALATCEAATKQFPSSHRAWAQLAVGQFRAGQRDRAIVAIDRALTLAPADGLLLANRGMILEGLGRDDEALDSYRRACRLGHSAACSHVGPR